jgi:hypothetical protein
MYRCVIAHLQLNTMHIYSTCTDAHLVTISAAALQPFAEHLRPAAKKHTQQRSLNFNVLQILEPNWAGATFSCPNRGGTVSKRLPKARCGLRKTRWIRMRRLYHVSHQSLTDPSVTTNCSVFWHLARTTSLCSTQRLRLYPLFDRPLLPFDRPFLRPTHFRTGEIAPREPHYSWRDMSPFK